MGHWYNPPPPQPAALHVPPNAAAATNIPPNPIGPGSTLVQSLWPQESWPTQELIGGGLAAQIAPPFVPPVAVAAANPTVLLTIREAWLPEQWDAQRSGRIASLYASPVTPPIAFPSPPRSVGALPGLWPQESWYAQSESAIAAGLAQIQLPPIYIPSSRVPRFALIRSLWLQEDWPAQTGTRKAAWIPPPVTPIPTLIRHPEILQWSPETWGAQGGTRAAWIVAGVPAALPYLNRALAAALRASWPDESWPAQTFPDIAGGNSPLTPPMPRPPSQFPISQWPVEIWGPQSGTRDAAIFAIPQLLIFMPYVVGELVANALGQLAVLFQPVVTLQYVYSGAPPLVVVDQSIPRGTLVFPGEALTLQVSIGPQRGPIPCPIVETTVICNIPVVLPLAPSNKKVLN